MYRDGPANSASSARRFESRTVVPQIDIRRGAEAIQTVVLTQASLVVGTAPEADIVLNLPGVLAQHFSIQVARDGSLEALNIASDPVLTHRGQSFDRTRLQDGSELELLGYTFRLELVEQDTPASPSDCGRFHPSMAPTIVAYRPLLRATGPDSQSSAVRLSEGRYLIGTEECEIVVPFGGVARHHAALTVHAEGFVTVEDLGSGAYTYLNRRPIDRAKFLCGDVLQVGSVVLGLGASEEPPQQLSRVPLREVPRPAQMPEPPPAEAPCEPSRPPRLAVVPPPLPPPVALAPPPPAVQQPAPEPAVRPVPAMRTVLPPRPRRGGVANIKPTTAVEIVALFEPESEADEAEFHAEFMEGRRRQLLAAGAVGAMMLVLVVFFAGWQVWLSFEPRRAARQLVREGIALESVEVPRYSTPLAPAPRAGQDDSTSSLDALRAAPRATLTARRTDENPRAWIDLSAVDGTLRDQVTPDANACYHHRLADSPRLKGTMVLDLVVGTDGRVSSVALDPSVSTLGDGGLLACVGRAIEAHPFPGAIGEPVTLQVPFLFE